MHRRLVDMCINSSTNCSISCKKMVKSVLKRSGISQFWFQLV